MDQILFEWTFFENDKIEMLKSNFWGKLIPRGSIGDEFRIFLTYGSSGGNTFAPNMLP